MSKPFWTRLLRAREKAGLSQAQVAKKFDYTQSAVSQWESGKKTPRKAVQEWILKTLRDCANAGEDHE